MVESSDLTIQGWKQRRDARREVVYPLALAAAVLILLGAVNAFFSHAGPKAKAKADDPQAYFNGFKIAFVNDAEDNPLPRPTKHELGVAVEVARLAWEGALQKPIKRPTVTFGDRNSCDSPNAYACAYVGENKIVIVRSPAGASLSTVLMHEIGHLLGVPHIEGDPLMNSSYDGGSVAGPSPFAVAIAKAADAERAR